MLRRLLITVLIPVTSLVNADDIRSPMLVYGANPLTVDKLKAEYGAALQKSDFWCSHPNRKQFAESDGLKCEVWSVKNVSLQVQFDHAFYRQRLDGTIDSVELVRSGDCNRVAAAYTQLMGAVLHAERDAIAKIRPDEMTYSVKNLPPHLKENVVSLSLREGSCSLSYKFKRTN